YKAGLKSVEERLEFVKTNESIYSENIQKLKFENHCNEITIRELRKKLETVQRDKDGIQLTIEKLENASKSLNKLIDSQIVDNAVPPPQTGLFMPPKPDLTYIGLEEFISKPVVERLNAKTSEDVPKVVKKDNGALIMEDWKQHDVIPVADEEETLILEEIQEKFFVTTTLQNELRRLKGKNVLDNATTIALEIFKLDMEPISHRLNNNKEAHEDYLKKTIENTDTIRGLVERARKLNPSETLLDSAGMFTKHIQ
nr:hypothetical protein [Tanacetum cinerariifolium]